MEESFEKKKSTLKRVSAKPKKKMTLELAKCNYNLEDLEQLIADFFPFKMTAKQTDNFITIVLTDDSNHPFDQGDILHVIKENIGVYSERRIRKSEERRVVIKEHNGKFFLNVLDKGEWDEDADPVERFEIFI